MNTDCPRCGCVTIEGMNPRYRICFDTFCGHTFEIEEDMTNNSTGLIYHRDTKTYTLIVNGVEHEITQQTYLDLRTLLGAR